MKRVLSFVLCAAILLSFPVMPLKASAATSGYYTYTVSNGAATITDCNTSISGDIVIPSTLGGYPVTAIDDWAFSSCDSVTAITIPNSVTSVGTYAFSSCDNLTSVIIGNSVSSIAEWAFSGCDSLTAIWVDANNRTYSSDSYGVLFNKEKTTLLQAPNGISGNYTIPDGVTSIRYGAFYDCANLTLVTIPASVSSIGNYAFQFCTSLESITIPDGVTRIGDSVFANCSKLTSITIPASVTSIDNAFYDCYWLTQVHVKDIAAWCNISFSGAINCHPMYYAQELYLNGELITDLVIPDSVTSISNSAFYSCESLTSVTIGNSTTTIGNHAFGDCSNLTLVTIGKRVTSIGAAAFTNCKKLTAISVPASVTSIGSNAFFCQGMTGIWVDENNTYYSSDSRGVLFNKDKTQLIQAPIAISGSYTIPGSVQSIGANAFQYCFGLTGVVISAGVTTINDYAFFNCTGLKSIDIPDSVKSIGPSALGQCTNLESVTIPDGVQSIGNQTFWDCTNLKDITIPASVTSIDTYAFYGCTSLTNVYFGGTAKQWAAITIGTNNNGLNNATIHTVAPTMTGISVKKQPNKTYYWVGESLDTTGLTLTAIYNDGTTANITEGFVVSGFDSATSGSKSVTVSYEGHSTAFNVTVKDVNITDGNGYRYETLTAGIKNVAAGSKLILLTDITEDVTIGKDIVLDLNGHSINGTITVSDGCTLYGMDSQTDDYTVEDDFGYGKLTDVVGNVVGLPEESNAAQDGYLMITEAGGISFHRVNLQISAMSLRASAAGVYFKSDFAADEVVAAQVKSFGVALSIKAMPNASNMSSCQYSTFKNFTAGENKDATSTLLKGIMKEGNAYLINKANANTDVYGRAYIQLADGSYIFGAGVQRSLRQQVEAIDATWASLSADQQASVVEMYRTYQSVMKSWEIPNIIAAA